MDQHQPDCQDLGPDVTREAIWRRPDLDRERGPLQGLRVPPRIFHAPGLGPGPMDQRQHQRIHPAVGGAGIRAGVCQRHRSDHFKGYEFPLEYFMHLAWDPDRWTNDNINEFTRLWAEREFGPAYAKDIAEIVAQYTQYTGRRKPELLAPDTYSLVNYQEAENVVTDFKTITAKAEEIYGKLPEAKRGAFYELVLFPTKASALALVGNNTSS